MEGYDLYKITIDITNRCNKSCKGCNHMIPLAKHFYDLDLIYLDKVFTELSNKLHFKLLCLAGGEPTLHPQLLNIVKLARKRLPDVKIKVITNGINLYKFFDKADEFNSLNCYFHISSYGDLNDNDFNLIKSYFKNVGIDKSYEKSKLFSSTNFDLNGNQDINYSWNNCRDRECLKIEQDGRLYQCPEMLRLNYIIDYFNLQKIDLKLEECSLDLFKSSREEIISFFSKPTSGCRFCNLKTQTKFIPGKSNKSIDEWVSKESIEERNL